LSLICGKCIYTQTLDVCGDCTCLCAPLASCILRVPSHNFEADSVRCTLCARACVLDVTTHSRQPCIHVHAHHVQAQLILTHELYSTLTPSVPSAMVGSRAQRSQMYVHARVQLACTGASAAHLKTHSTHGTRTSSVPRAMVCSRAPMDSSSMAAILVLQPCAMLMCWDSFLVSSCGGGGASATQCVFVYVCVRVCVRERGERWKCM
jgi:hypothetical protein